MKLSRKAKKAINQKVKLEMAIKLGVHPNTIYNWLKTDSEKLTTKRTIETITELTGINESEMFQLKNN